MKVKIKGPNNKTYEVWIETIGPEQASKYLKNLGKQRKIREAHITKLTDIMKENHFDSLNGDTIVFDSEDRMMDGQHRMQAIIASGHEITTFCISGVAKDVYFSMDQGQSPRKLRDLLGILGEQYTTELATALGCLWRYKNTCLGQRKSGVLLLDNRVAYQLLKRNPTLRASVKWSAVVSKEAPSMHLGKGFISFLHYVLTKIDSEKAMEFLDTITYNIQDPIIDCPAYILRQRFKKADMPINRRDRVGVLEKTAWTIKAWNLFIQDRHVIGSRLFVWRLGESFPLIKDSEGEIFSYNHMIKS